MRLHILLSATLAACVEAAPDDQKVDEPDACTLVRYVDADGDSYGDDAQRFETCAAAVGVERGGDCDDADPGVHPDASEVCNGGVDDDCDGSADEDDASGTTAWHADADGDGYGDPSASVSACEAPASYVNDATDCDDTDAAVNPGGTETCETDADDDCDGSVNATDAPGCVDWYEDADGDDWGTDATACLCQPDTPYLATVAGDCDDTDAAVHPDARERDNDLDEDCDGLIDISLAATGADARLYAAYGASGGTLAGLGDMNGDGYDDVLVGIVNSDAAGPGAGAAAVVFGPILGAFDLAGADASLLGNSGDAAGERVAALGDVDGDGWPDLAVGGAHGGTDDQGGAWLVHGPVTGRYDLGAADATWTGTNRNEYVGGALAGGGDLDGDDLPDLLLAAWGAQTGGFASGSIYLFSGLVTGTPSLSDGTAELIGVGTSNFAASALDIAADVNGDGVADAIVGSAYDDTGGNQGGAVYVVHGPLSGVQSLSDADAILVGEDGSDGAGGALDAGDLDGDGLDDVLVGARAAGSNTAGRVYVVSSPSGTLDLARADAMFVTGALGIGVGGSVAIAGDLDGDGAVDVVIGAEGANDSSGGAWLEYGPFAGARDLDTTGVHLRGTNMFDECGAAAAGVGDVDGDGLSDVLIGAPRADERGVDGGASYLLYGR
ncbi:MAG: MopE-related protein [Myxococcota bacterium]